VGLRRTVAFLLLSFSGALVAPAGSVPCNGAACSGSLGSFFCGDPASRYCDTSKAPNGSGQVAECRGCSAQPNCRRPLVSDPSLEVTPEAGGTFKVRFLFQVTAPWNPEAGDSLSPYYNPNGTLQMIWFSGGGVPTCFDALLAEPCYETKAEIAYSWLERSGLSCAGAPYAFGTFSFVAQSCNGICSSSCQPWWTAKSNLTFAVTPEDLGCPSPRKHECDCTSCKLVGPGGGSLGGGGGNASPGDSGPGAMLRYAAGGAGGTGFPGTAAWRTALGRFWSHDYAERIVVDPDDSHVWLITRWATFRELSNLAGGVYTARSPDATRSARSTGPPPAGSCTSSTAPSTPSTPPACGRAPPTATATPRSPPTPPAGSPPSPSRTAGARPSPTTRAASSPRSPRSASGAR
jgi:hypothetical protein